MAFDNSTAQRDTKLTMRTVAVVSLVALFGALAALIGSAPAATAQTSTTGCGTDVLEIVHTIGQADGALVGNDGPAAATSTIDLDNPLAAGSYEVRAVSADSHWSERRDQPREQYTVTVGSQTVGPTTDLPLDADFIGSTTDTATDEDLANVPVDVFPGESIGTIELTGAVDRFTLTHVDGGAGQGSNSISAHQITFTCLATGLGLSFDSASSPLLADGSAVVELSVSNGGAADHTGIVVRGVLPSGVDRNGIVCAPSGTTSSVGATIRWEGDLAAGETVVVAIPVVATPAGYAQCVADDGSCTLVAEIVGADAGASGTEPATTDLTATADLEVTTNYAPANGDFEQLGGTVTVSITNAPGDLMSVTADGLVIESDIGSSLSIDPASVGATAGTVSLDGDILRWNIDRLAPGESAAYSVSVALPGAGTFSVRTQVVASSAADPDSTPNSLSDRSGDDDISAVEDDEAAAAIIATSPSTTTSTFTTTSLPPVTTRAPLVVEIEATTQDAEPSFQLDLTEQEVIDLTSLDEPEVESTDDSEDDDRTEVAGAIELPAEGIPTIAVDQDNRVPLAALLAVLLVALSAGVVIADRRAGKKASLASGTITNSTIDTE